jgi:hypothetical protein
LAAWALLSVVLLLALTVSRMAVSWLGLAVDMPTMESELPSDADEMDIRKPRRLNLFQE